MDPLIVPIHDRRIRLAGRLELAGHGAAVFGLVAAAMDALPARGAGPAALVAAELAAAAALVFAIVREARGPAEGDEPARIGWLNLVAGVILLGGWYGRFAGGGKAFSPPLVSGILAICLAFLHPLVQRRRAARRMLRMDDEGLSIRTGRMTGFAARWAELRSVEAAPGALRFVLADGRERRVSLRHAANAAEIADAVCHAAAPRLHG